METEDEQMLADKHLWEEVKGTRVGKKGTVLAEITDGGAKQPVEQCDKGRIRQE